MFLEQVPTNVMIIVIFIVIAPLFYALGYLFPFLMDKLIELIEGKNNDQEYS